MRNPAATHAIAAGLRRRMPAGAKVAVYCGNDARMLMAIYGIMRADCVFVPLNARNGSAEVAAILASYDCTAVFVDRDIAADLPILRSAMLGLIAIGIGDDGGGTCDAS